MDNFDIHELDTGERVGEAIYNGGEYSITINGKYLGSSPVLMAFDCYHSYRFKARVIRALPLTPLTPSPPLPSAPLPSPVPLTVTISPDDSVDALKFLTYSMYKCYINDLDGRKWYRILAKHPQFSYLCEFDKLNGYHWCKLLMVQPTFSYLCDFTKLEARHWNILLAKQPQLSHRR